MPLTITRYMVCGRGGIGGCRVLNHTLHAHTLAGLGCKGGRAVSLTLPHPTTLAHPYSTNRIPDNNEKDKMTSISDFNGEKSLMEGNKGGLKGGEGVVPSLGSQVVPKGSILPSSGVFRKPDDWNDILNRWYEQYQDFVGITDLKKAQDRVTELSEGLLSAQGERRRLQAEIEEVQARLEENHQRITKTEQYSQDHMRLFNEAKELNDTLRSVRTHFSQYEQTERDTFTHLSAAIRDCHERERMQAEQGKYWSIIASVVSAALASVITSVNNWVRIREIKDHVTTSQQTLIEGFTRMQSAIQDTLGQENTRKYPPSIPEKNTQKYPEIPLENTLIDGKYPSVPAESAREINALREINEELISLGQKVAEDIKTAREINAEFISLTQTITNDITNISNEVISTLNEAIIKMRQLEGEGTLAPPTPPIGVGVGGGDVGYFKVGGTMLFGAALGTLITAFFLGALGGPPG